MSKEAPDFCYPPPPKNYKISSAFSYNFRLALTWFLLCTKRPVKPLIYQQRKKAKFVSKTNETDDNVFMSKKFIYGADSRGNAGFGFWQMAYGSDGTTT